MSAPDSPRCAREGCGKAQADHRGGWYCWRFDAPLSIQDEGFVAPVETAPRTEVTPASELPAHISDVRRMQMRRWANRLRGRYGVPVYLVGSALREDNPDPRDWDFRLTLPDEEFVRHFGPVEDWNHEGCTGDWGRTRLRWSEQCVKDTKDAVAWMLLNADVQIYPASHVAAMYADLPRVRIDSFPDEELVATPQPVVAEEGRTEERMIEGDQWLRDLAAENAEKILRRHMAMYDWGKRETVAINDFILTIREGLGEELGEALLKMRDTAVAPVTTRLHALEAAARALDAIVGCGDNSCLFKKPKGMATNGGCRCSRKPAFAQVVAELYRSLTPTTEDHDGR